MKAGRDMKIKVCGMKFRDNIDEIAKLVPDYMGFIFYEPSPRFVGNQLDTGLVNGLPREIRKVGVFVNASNGYLLNQCRKFGCTYIQLHGDEPPSICRELRSEGLKVIKAFGVDEAFDFGKLTAYESYCDYFLFDTHTQAYGGSGRRFDWTCLNPYTGSLPFFLSGGIGPGDAPDILRLRSLPVHAVDLNSRFESEAGVKEVSHLSSFIQTLRNTNIQS